MSKCSWSGNDFTGKFNQKNLSEVRNVRSSEKDADAAGHVEPGEPALPTT